MLGSRLAAAPLLTRYVVCAPRALEGERDPPRTAEKVAVVSARTDRAAIRDLRLGVVRLGFGVMRGMGRAPRVWLIARVAAAPHCTQYSKVTTAPNRRKELVAEMAN
jgi:hypothetical protein